MASSWQKKKAAHPVRADGRMCYLYKKTTEFVRGLVIYQAAFFAAVLPFGPFFRALASSSLRPIAIGSVNTNEGVLFLLPNAIITLLSFFVLQHSVEL